MTPLIVSTLLSAIGLILILWIHNQYHLDIVVKPIPAPQNAPRIAVCVPARNEQANIRRCIESLLSQDYPNLEIIVLDDQSTDSTPAILQELAGLDPRLKILIGSPLPEGWAGKPHALHQAAAVAHGDWLCFVDADTYFSPQAISSCYGKAEETNADLFTIMTDQELGSFWEKTVMPLVMTALSVGFPPRRVNDPNHRDAVANGQFIMIRHRVYGAIGGYENIRNQIVEDKALSEQVKWNGFRLVVADGSQVVRTRMYTTLAGMWEGWTKNIYLGLRDRPSLMLLGALGASLAVIAALFLPLWSVLGIAWLGNGGGWEAGLVILESLSVWMVLIHYRVRVGQRMKISPWFAFLTPLGSAVFAGMMFSSAWKVLSRKGVQWKGRRYIPA